MYYNEEHKRRVIERGDGYEYIGSYHSKEITIDGKYFTSQSALRVKCPYCGEEYDVSLGSFINKKSKCTNCCNFYENSFAYYVQQELKEPLNKYWDWEKNNELGINPYHIKPQSNKKVYIKCTETDYHGSYITILYQFTTGGRCPHCVNQNGKIHPKDSFGQWLIDTYGNDAIEKYWSPKNKLNPFEIAPQNTDKIYILCQQREYHNDYGGYKTTPHQFYRNRGCSYCGGKKVHPKDSFAQWGIDTFGEDFLEKYWNWDKNNELGINPWKIKPGSTSHKVWIYCQNKNYHNDNGGYLITPGKFKDNRRCPYCETHHGKVHPLDSFGALYPEKAKYWSENNNISSFKVAPKSNKKYKFICEKCGDEFERSLSKLNQVDAGVVCRDCRGSQLETRTKRILEKYGINFEQEKTFFELIGEGGQPLRFDFYLPNYNLLIELHGSQHEKYNKHFQKTIDDFKRLKTHDKRKEDYCKANSIPLLIIWYYDFNNIEKILIKRLNLK